MTLNVPGHYTGSTVCVFSFLEQTLRWGRKSCNWRSHETLSAAWVWDSSKRLCLVWSSLFSRTVRNPLFHWLCLFACLQHSLNFEEIIRCEARGTVFSCALLENLMWWSVMLLARGLTWIQTDLLPNIEVIGDKPVAFWHFSEKCRLVPSLQKEQGTGGRATCINYTTI